MTDVEVSPSGAADDPEPLETASSGSGRKQPRWAVAAAVSFFVTTLVLALVAASLAGRLDDERRDERDVARVTGEVAEALFTYDFENLDDTKARVLAVATGKFRKEYEATFPSLRQLLTETKATAQATVKDVFVSDIRAGNAMAIAVVDASVSGLSGSNRRADSYLRVTLVKVEGRWQVDDALSINFGGTGTTSPTTKPKDDAGGTTVPPG